MMYCVMHGKNSIVLFVMFFFAPALTGVKVKSSETFLMIKVTNVPAVRLFFFLK